VVIRNENIALGLAILSHYVKRQKHGTSRPAAPVTPPPAAG
jgi:hypothetical protein